MGPRSALLPASLFLTEALLLPTGCRRSAERTTTSEATPAAASEGADAPQVSTTPVAANATPAKVAAPRGNTPPPPAEIWNEFSGTKAMAEVEKQVAFGPRPAGSIELLGARKAIVASLQAS